MTETDEIAEILNDMDHGAMNIQSWVNSGIHDLCAFGTWWLDQNRENPDEYPAFLTNSDWERAFKRWFLEALRKLRSSDPVKE